MPPTAPFVVAAGGHTVSRTFVQEIATVEKLVYEYYFLAGGTRGLWGMEVVFDDVRLYFI